MTRSKVIQIWFARWRRRFTTRPPRVEQRPVRIVRDSRPVAGEYELLHKYLRDRFADRVVLTFGELEDLLGFSLPALARVHLAWWDGGDFVSAPSTQSFAWRLAGRTATVNLPAQSVVFERDPET